MLNIPPTITSGDTVEWYSHLSEYPSEDFVLSWSIRGNVSLDATASQSDNSSYLTALTGVQTSTLTPGEYFWQAYVTDTDNNRTNVGKGRLTVFPNLANQSAPYDGRSEAEKMLEQVGIAISKVMDGQEYRIKERELTRADLAELIKWRDQLRWEVRREQDQQAIANGMPDPSKVKTRFRRW